jgi:hypothetical protein
MATSKLSSSEVTSDSIFAFDSTISQFLAVSRNYRFEVDRRFARLQLDVGAFFALRLCMVLYEGQILRSGSSGKFGAMFEPIDRLLADLGC